MLPLLLMPGAGSAIYRGLAAVIVGGLSVSTLFTIILLPCLLQFRARDFGLASNTKGNRISNQFIIRIQGVHYAPLIYLAAINIQRTVEMLDLTAYYPQIP